MSINLKGLEVLISLLPFDIRNCCLVYKFFEVEFIIIVYMYVYFDCIYFFSCISYI